MLWGWQIVVEYDSQQINHQQNFLRMSWLRPEGIQPSDYDPEDRVSAFFKEYPKTGELVLKAFTEVDPFKIVFGNNPDEYLGYAKRCIQALGDDTLGTIGEEELMLRVRNAFHASQIEQQLVDDEKIQEIARKILASAGDTDVTL